MKRDILGIAFLISMLVASLITITICNKQQALQNNVKDKIEMEVNNEY